MQLIIEGSLLTRLVCLSHTGPLATQSMRPRLTPLACVDTPDSMACAEHQLRFNPWENFVALLARTSINKPRAAVLQQVRVRLVNRLGGVATPSHAEELYREAASFPASETARHLLEEHGLTINGPRFLRCAETPCLWTKPAAHA